MREFFIYRRKLGEEMNEGSVKSIVRYFSFIEELLFHPSEQSVVQIDNNIFSRGFEIPIIFYYPFHSLFPPGCC